MLGGGEFTGKKINGRAKVPGMFRGTTGGQGREEDNRDNRVKKRGVYSQEKPNRHTILTWCESVNGA